MAVSISEISVEHLEELSHYYHYQTSEIKLKRAGEIFEEEIRRREFIRNYESKNQFGRNYVEIIRKAREIFSKDENFKMYKAFVEEKAYYASKTLEEFRELRKCGDFLNLLD